MLPNHEFSGTNPIDIEKLRTNLDKLYIEKWKTSNSNNKKLKIYYELIKETKTYELQSYLTSISNSFHRQSLSKLRISNHILHVETGRHNKVDKNKRTCRQCNENVIENEEHFILHCSKFTDARMGLLSHMQSFSPGFIHMPDAAKIEKILNIQCENPIVCAKLLHDLYMSRKASV